MYKLSLAHLYPKLLNICCDTGNIITLKNRCEWRNIEFSLTEINADDNINPDNFDFYFISGGKDLQQAIAAQEIQKQKAALIAAREKNSVFLAINGGYQLLGEYYQFQNGEKIPGAELLDCYTIIGEKRFTGNVTAKTGFLTPQTLAGFENHNGLTYLKNDTEPLATVEIGNGNNGEDKTEGARKNNIFGTYIQGSMLAENVHFADYLIKLALEAKYNDKIELTPLDDETENTAHKIIVGKAY